MAAKRRVLIVEDDPGTSRLILHIVERAGYQAVLASNGQQALQHLQEDGADLLLLDLMMRGMDGWALLEHVKSDEDLADLPVIIISAVHPREDPARVESYAGQFEAYFVKPFEVDVLVSTMDRLLNG